MMLSTYKHENLISLMHYAVEGDEMILVYEYASRGSLDRYLTNDTTLTWTQRLKICVGVARGLHFLHDPKSTQQRVLHRDIKSANILLDENWTAKVSDFGLSKLGPANQPHSYLISHAVGTPGYCDPLYWELGFLSKESDVYSFGVVLFEILCGRLCYEQRNHELTEILVPKWRRSYDENRLDEIILSCLKDQMDPGSLETFSAIAYRCVKKAREDRPIVAEIVEKLEFSLVQQEIFENAHKNSNRDRASFFFNGQADQSLDNGHHHNFERRFQDLVTDDYHKPPPVSDADDSYDLEDEKNKFIRVFRIGSDRIKNFRIRIGPGIEGLKITGDPKPGKALLGCGYSGEIVRVFANEQKKITCDPEMQQEIDNYMLAGQKSFSTSLLMGTSNEAITFYLGQYKYKILINSVDKLYIFDKYSSDLSIKIPQGLTSNIVLIRPRGSPLEFDFHDVR
ncbi:hypothetical protein R6Q57_006717 [Mikania cordata]